MWEGFGSRAGTGLGTPGRATSLGPRRECAGDGTLDMCAVTFET